MYTVKELNQKYSGFFKSAGQLAISPLSFSYDIGKCITQGYDNNVAKGAALIAIGLIASPIIAIATAVTFSLAALGAFIAAASTLFAYPAAATAELCAPEFSHV